MKNSTSTWFGRAATGAPHTVAIQQIADARYRAGRVLALPPRWKMSDGAPASGTALLVRARAKAPCRRPAFRWQCHAPHRAPTLRPRAAGAGLVVQIFNLPHLPAGRQVADLQSAGCWIGPAR